MEHDGIGRRREFRIASCGCLLLFLCFGLAYSMPVLFPTLAERFAAPIWHFAAYFSIGGALYFTVGGLAGTMADRYGTPVVVTLGLLIGAVGLLIASVARSEIIFAMAYIVAVGAGCGLTYAPVTAAVQRLCPRDPIVAAGLTSAGIGFGSLLFPPMMAWLSRVWDWRFALQTMAVVTVIGILPVLALTRAVEPGMAMHAACRLRSNRRFVLAYVTQVLMAIVTFVPFAHLVNIALNNGWSATEGVELISLVGFGSTVGRFLVVPLARRQGPCQTAALLAYVMAFAVAGLAVLPLHWTTWTNVTIFGLSYGGFTALTAPIVVEVCGPVHVGRNVGILISARAIGILLGPWAVGVGAWWLELYTWPLIACAVVAVVAAVCMGRCAAREAIAAITA